MVAADICRRQPVWLESSCYCRRRRPSAVCSAVFSRFSAAYCCQTSGPTSALLLHTQRATMRYWSHTNGGAWSFGLLVHKGTTRSLLVLNVCARRMSHVLVVLCRVAVFPTPTLTLSWLFFFSFFLPICTQFTDGCGKLRFACAGVVTFCARNVDFCSF